LSDSKLNQGSELNEIVNKRNKWLFNRIDSREDDTKHEFEISKYLVKRNNSLFIPSGNIWYSSLRAYPSYIINSLKLIYFLVKQLFSDKTSFQTKSAHIVFTTRGGMIDDGPSGISRTKGLGYDLKNYSKFFPNNNVEVIHMEAFNTSQKINLNIVKTTSAFSFLLENIREANHILKLKLPLDLRKNIVNHSLPQLAVYTYLCAFVSAIKEQIPNVKIIHTGAILLSCAANRVGTETIYLSHGLASKFSDYHFPFDDYIYVYSDEEKSYFENISPNSNVCLYPVQELSKLEKRVIIFLRASDSFMSEKILSEVLTLFSQKGYQIFLKRHPMYTIFRGSLAYKLVEAYNLEITDQENEKDASEIILNLRPSFTVSWKSTSLCESLRHGVIPISLSLSINPDTMIYPFKKRSLSWVEEKERIFDLLEDTSLYTKTLSELRMR